MVNRIVVVGTANADLVVRIPRRPVGGETVQGSDLVVTAGGKGANQAVAAALQDADVLFVGCVGGDSYGDLLRASLRDAGVDVTWLATAPDTPSGTALVMLTPDAENSIIVTPGANRLVDVELLQKAEPAWAEAALGVMQLEAPMETVEFMARECRRRGVRFLLNAAPAAPLSEDVLSACDPLVVNESEAQFLLGETAEADPADLARRLLDTGPASVVLTLGSAGALAMTESETIHQPAHRVTAVDTTGAGDAFVGALATVLAQGGTLARGLALGAAVAAHAVQGVGAQASYPRRADIETLEGARP